MNDVALLFSSTHRRMAYWKHFKIPIKLNQLGWTTDGLSDLIARELLLIKLIVRMRSRVRWSRDCAKCAFNIPIMKIFSRSSRNIKYKDKKRNTWSSLSSCLECCWSTWNVWTIYYRNQPKINKNGNFVWIWSKKQDWSATLLPPNSAQESIRQVSQLRFKHASVRNVRYWHSSSHWWWIVSHF